MESDAIEIALAADGKYFCGLLVAACSIAKYADPEAELHFNILDGGIEDEDWSVLSEKLSECHSNSKCRRLPVNEEVFAAYPEWSLGSRMPYARLLLAELLPDVDHVIYCDIDYIWLADISKLWELRDDDVMLQSSRDGVRETEEKERIWHEKHGFRFDPDRYFCTGLSFCNLRLFREEGIARKISDFLVAHPDVPFVDQTAMNVILGERTRLLPQTWQRFSRDVTDADLMGGCAVHFAGETPWRKLGPWINAITDAMLIWHRFNAKLHGISTWQSLRRWYGAGEIVGRRMLFYLASVAILRSLFFQFLRFAGRGVYINHFKIWCRPLKLKGMYLR